MLQTASVCALALTGPAKCQEQHFLFPNPPSWKAFSSLSLMQKCLALTLRTAGSDPYHMRLGIVKPGLKVLRYLLSRDQAGYPHRCHHLPWSPKGKVSSCTPPSIMYRLPVTSFLTMTLVSLSLVVLRTSVSRDH